MGKQTEYEPIISDFLFAQPKKYILVEIPFSANNENNFKQFLDKSQSFIQHKLDIGVE